MVPSEFMEMKVTLEEGCEGERGSSPVMEREEKSNKKNGLQYILVTRVFLRAQES